MVILTRRNNADSYGQSHYKTNSTHPMSRHQEMPANIRHGWKWLIESLLRYQNKYNSKILHITGQGNIFELKFETITKIELKNTYDKYSAFNLQNELKKWFMIE